MSNDVYVIVTSVIRYKSSRIPIDLQTYLLDTQSRHTWNAKNVNMGRSKKELYACNIEALGRSYEEFYVCKMRLWADPIKICTHEVHFLKFLDILD